MFRARYMEFLLTFTVPLSLASCAKSDTQVCADGLRCPVGMECMLTVEGWACSAPVCGNQLIDPGELCDGGEAGVCVDYGYDLGVARCGGDCRTADVAECRDLQWRDEAATFELGFEAVWSGSRNLRFAVTDDGQLLRFDGDIWRREPIGNSEPLSDVWGRGDADVFAVGDGGVILQFNGREWLRNDLAEPLGLQSVVGAQDGAEPGGVYAVAREGVVLAYDGEVWAQVDLPGAVADASALYGLSGVAVTAAGDVLAVGGRDDLENPDNSGEPGLILERSADGWVAVRPPRPQLRVLDALPNDSVDCDATSAGYLRSVWSQGEVAVAVGAIDCRSQGVAIAEGVQPWIVYRERGVWRSEPVSKNSGWNGTELADVWGSATDNVFAVGSGGRILHYDGQRWTDMTTPQGNDLRGVSGLASDDVIAVGAAGTILRFRGASLDNLGPLPLDRLILADIAAVASGAIYAVGQIAPDNPDILDGLSRAVLLQHDGVHWRPHPGAPFLGDPLVDVRGELTAVEAFADDVVIAVGKPDMELGSFATICNPDECRNEPILDDVILYDLWGSAVDEVFAVGAVEGGTGGVIMAYDGLVWARVEGIEPPAPLRAIWGAARDAVYAAGDAGQLWRYDGANWERAALDLLGDGDDLRAVWGSGGDDIFAAGVDGLVLRYDGAAWKRVPIEDDVGDIDKLSGFGRGDVVALVSGGEYDVWRFDGEVWAPVGSPLVDIEHRGMSKVASDGTLLLVGADSAHRLSFDLR